MKERNSKPSRLERALRAAPLEIPPEVMKRAIAERERKERDHAAKMLAEAPAAREVKADVQAKPMREPENKRSRAGRIADGIVEAFRNVDPKEFKAMIERNRRKEAEHFEKSMAEARANPLPERRVGLTRFDGHLGRGCAWMVLV